MKKGNHEGKHVEKAGKWCTREEIKRQIGREQREMGAVYKHTSAETATTERVSEQNKTEKQTVKQYDRMWEYAPPAKLQYEYETVKTTTMPLSKTVGKT